MADATARLDPEVLSSALRDVTGVTTDPTTDHGTLQAARLLAEVLGKPGGQARMLAAINTHADARIPEEWRLPRPGGYGPVATRPGRDAALTYDMAPPIGSPEFDAYLDRPQRLHDAPGTYAVMTPLDAPQALGFEGTSAEGLPRRSTTIEVLLTVQRALERKVRQRHRSLAGRLRAAYLALHSQTSQWSVQASQRAGNRFVVEAVNCTHSFCFECLASGESLYMVLWVDGELRFKEQVSLTDHAPAQQRLADAFAHQPAVGAAAFQTLRMALARDVWHATASPSAS